MGALERLLVRLPNHLGDLLMARSLLAALRAEFPAAEVRAVAPGGLLALLEDDPARITAEPWMADGSAAGRLKRWRPQAALVLPPSFSSAWFAWRTGAPIRVGHRGDGRRALLTHALARAPRGDRHLSDEYLDLGAVLGAAPCAVPALVPNERGRAEAHAALAASAAPGGAWAVLAPAARYGPAKRWPPARFVALGRELLRHGLVVVLCGGADEARVCDQVALEIGAGAVSLAGRTSLAALTALVAEAGCVVCNDSGVAHLAAATGAPTVAVFGSTSSAWTTPRGPRAAVVQRPPVCAPCFQRTCAIGYRCLEAVEVGDVLRAWDRVRADGRAA